MSKQRIGERRMPVDLQRAGFRATVMDVGDYFRVSYCLVF